MIELRGGENRQLREENNKLKNKLDDHHWLETELGKAKHRLEELTIIVQNKMVSERSAAVALQIHSRSLYVVDHHVFGHRSQSVSKTKKPIL